MSIDPLSPHASLRREIAERLASFFDNATDGRNASVQADAAVASSQGPHREQNEDRCAAVRFRFGTARADIRLGVLCDGMGGMAKGGEAASMAIASFIAVFATLNFDCSIDERLYEACEYANRAVFNNFHGGAGTTLTAIAMGARSTYAVHVGDSRLYGIDAAKRVFLVTQDDTVSGAVNAHLGQDDEDDLDNRLLQYVGIGPHLNSHVISLEDAGDTEMWLLTSDGAHSVGKKVLSGVCRGSRSPSDLVRKIVFVSEAVDTQDNATALCIRAKQYGPFNEDQHEGLTLFVSSPDRSIEIWVPESALMMAQSTENDLFLARQRVVDASNALGNELPRQVKTRQKRSTAKRKKGSTSDAKNKKIEPNLPLEITFESDEKND